MPKKPEAAAVPKGAGPASAFRVRGFERDLSSYGSKWHHIAVSSYVQSIDQLKDACRKRSLPSDAPHDVLVSRILADLMQ